MFRTLHSAVYLLIFFDGKVFGRYYFLYIDFLTLSHIHLFTEYRGRGSQSCHCKVRQKSMVSCPNSQLESCFSTFFVLVGLVFHLFLFGRHRSNAKLVGMNGWIRLLKRQNGQRYFNSALFLFMVLFGIPF